MERESRDLNIIRPDLRIVSTASWDSSGARRDNSSGVGRGGSHVESDGTSRVRVREMSSSEGGLMGSAVCFEQSHKSFSKVAVVE